jgi:hypothetical protein
VSAQAPKQVICAEHGGPVEPYSFGVQHEVVGWATLKAPGSARRRGGGLNTIARWHETGRVVCADCARKLATVGNAQQESMW